jgi:hypothetical protein
VSLIARFQVDSFEPRQVAGLDAEWLGVMTFAKIFTSGIIGESTTLFMSAGTEEGCRSYVATERIGSFGTRAGQWHRGRQSPSRRLATWGLYRGFTGDAPLGYVPACENAAEVEVLFRMA